MKQPDLFGDLAAKSLYFFDESFKTKNNVANPKPTLNIDFFGPPSLPDDQFKAKQDGRILAQTLQTLNDDLDSFLMDFEAIEAKYPFNNCDLRKVFWEVIHHG